MDGSITLGIMILASVIYIFGWLMFLVAAFRESIWWGLACLFIPIVQLIFLIVHWREARKPFFLQLLALVLFIVAILVSPQGAHR